MIVVDNRKTKGFRVADIPSGTVFNGTFGGLDSLFMKVGTVAGRVIMFNVNDTKQTWTDINTGEVADYRPVNAILTIS